MFSISWLSTRNGQNAPSGLGWGLVSLKYMGVLYTMDGRTEQEIDQQIGVSTAVMMTLVLCGEKDAELKSPVLAVLVHLLQPKPMVINQKKIQDTSN